MVKFGMTYIAGHDRSQLLLLPEAVDDYVGSDNPVRFIDAFVDGLDLAAAGFGRVEPKVTGRPAYAPADLLKLYTSRTSFAGSAVCASRPISTTWLVTCCSTISLCLASTAICTL